METSRPDDAAPRLCVLAAEPLLTVTIEASGHEVDVPDVHVHAGGQGLWISRMAASLGATVTVCGPFGGETGSVLAHLAKQESFDVRTTTSPSNGAYVHDRRDGERREIARMPSPLLDRHCLDDLYGTVLVASLDADVCVLTGTEESSNVPPSFFGRLAHDLRAAGRIVVADLSRGQAKAVMDVEGVVLKISHEEMVEGGFADDDTLDSLRSAAEDLIAGGLGGVVLSRAHDPALVVTAKTVATVTTPPITTVDHRGAGDSMTAGIAVGLGRGETLASAARLGAAAGALNVTRRGLGTGRREQIERYAQQVRVDLLD
ncbi:1-phosphofructokinase [Flavimobilis soli]|uniref:1-phosphofructokinase n=1 Tax=Flavimobilis soli TaxID=442709 RepID=A0A2A9ECM9_9MICO|nr:PfkB family carbohydrate kinase [Flavimobilis soli]PFG36553.1 1-phosphofructokinase [Flavimobilis soli]